MRAIRDAAPAPGLSSGAPTNLRDPYLVRQRTQLSFRVRLRGIALTGCAFIFLQISPAREVFAAGSPVIEHRVYNVVDFGADPIGEADSRRAIQAAIDICEPGVSCELHFPPGEYAIFTPPTGSPGAISIPANVRITLSGAGEALSILVPEHTAATPSWREDYNIISVSPAAAGFRMHGIGIQ